MGYSSSRAWTSYYSGDGEGCGSIYDDGCPPTPPMQAHRPVLRPVSSSEELGGSSACSSMLSAARASASRPHVKDADGSETEDGGGENYDAYEPGGQSGNSRGRKHRQSRRQQEPQHRRPERRNKAARASVLPSQGDAIIISVMDGGGRTPEIAIEAGLNPLPPLEESEDEYDDSAVFCADDYDYEYVGPPLGGGGGGNYEKRQSGSTEEDLLGYHEKTRDGPSAALARQHLEQQHRQCGANFDGGKELATTTSEKEERDVQNVQGRALADYKDVPGPVQAGWAMASWRWGDHQEHGTLSTDKHYSGSRGGRAATSGHGREGGNSGKVQKRKKQGNDDNEEDPRVRSPKSNPRGRGVGNSGVLGSRGYGSSNSSSNSSSGSHGRRFALGLASLRKTTAFQQARPGGTPEEGQGCSDDSGSASSGTIRGDGDYPAYTPSGGSSSSFVGSPFGDSPGCHSTGPRDADHGIFGDEA